MRRRGRPIDPSRYRELIKRVWAAVEEDVPPSSTLLVVSRGDDELLRHPTVRARHFPEAKDGSFAGFHPADSISAIRHLEDLRDQGGATHILLPSTAFWWLEHYEAFRNHLESNYQAIRKDDDVVIYRLVDGPKDGNVLPWTQLGGNSSQATGSSTSAYVDQVLSLPTVRDGAFAEHRPHEPQEHSVKAIAFYLPQFHPIPENDQWWGRGFTEWSNVSKAVPQFVDHYQPRLPGELGFYDLRLPDIQRAQVAMARNYGIYGFCFHYYWFNGKQLLERPLENYLHDDSLDLPFCISWANENWTRRWDGLDEDVLLEQRYSADQDLQLARSVASILRDPRYIRVAGKPLFLVYRPSLLPNASETVARWRRAFVDLGIGDVFLACAQFDAEDPRPFGFDAAVEFPPHKVGWNLPLINDRLQIANQRYTGRVHEYAAMADAAQAIPATPYPLFRGVTPSWDNEARKPGSGTTFHGSTPEKYAEWLAVAGRYATSHPVEGERFVFVNAWNEWAEGAYLEPDRRYGYAYLEATRAALLSVAQRSSPARLLLVVHDAHNHGAQQNALHIAKGLSERFGISLDIVLLGEGELRTAFERYGRLHDFASDVVTVEQQEARLTQLRAQGVEAAIVNSAASGRIVPMLKAAGFRIATLVHELPGLLHEYGLEQAARDIAQLSDTVVFPADVVRHGFESIGESLGDRARIRPQGLYRDPTVVAPTRRARRTLKRRLGIPERSQVVLAVGWADLRKGFDLFIRVAGRVVASEPDAMFIWLGCEDPDLRAWYTRDAEILGFAESLRLLPRVENVADYFAAADVLLLPSREDPFPSVVLEALSQGTPVVAFEGATGVSDLLHSGCGVLVPYANTVAMANTVKELLNDEENRRRLGHTGRRLVGAQYAWTDYLYDLLGYLGHEKRKVSVIVPNFNYADHLERRLQSIFDQTYPIREVIVLDDGSTDDSIATLEALRDRPGWDFRIVANKLNSGSAFRQWLKGVRMAQGELVWIAEADDFADPDFLERLVPAFDSGTVVLGYAQSRQVDANGTVMANDYLDYVNDIDRTKWRKSWVRHGTDELADTLVIKNTIPNVSGVLFDRIRLRSVLADQIGFVTSFRAAGDWAVYVHMLLAGGDIAFVAEPLNNHRRHERSVTRAAFGSQIVAEIERMQHTVLSRVPTNRIARAKASRYLGVLRTQFGLKHPARPRRGACSARKQSTEDKVKARPPVPVVRVSATAGSQRDS